MPRDLLREHLRNYPAHSTAGAALYFLGRHAESTGGDFGAARACYQRLSGVFENHYYAMLARDRLSGPRSPSAAPSSETARVSGALCTCRRPQPVPSESTRATTAAHRALAPVADRRAERPGRFRAALRRPHRRPAGAARHGDGRRRRRSAPGHAHHESMAPEYLNLPLDQAPRQFWELLFPLPYRTELVRGRARARTSIPTWWPG